jgi:uncharacterized protein YbjT (DUF2867 family)
MGRALCAALVERGHRVCALVRPGSEGRAAAGCQVVTGNPLDTATFRKSLEGVHTFVHLVGVAHPNPSRAAEFRSIDLASAQQAVRAASAARVSHFVYVSVAHPAPVMREYIAARMEAERAIRDAGLNATILRPWYVLGPGRRWPLALMPAYFLLGLFPPTRAGARRLGLVTLPQMVAALALAVEQPPQGVRIVEVPRIRVSRL